MNYNIHCPHCGTGVTISTRNSIAIKQPDKSVIGVIDCPACGEEIEIQHYQAKVVNLGRSRQSESKTQQVTHA